MCPIQALEDWLTMAGIQEGPIFRSISRYGRALEKRLSPEAVGRIIKARAKDAGLDPKEYSGHSLRAGFVTQAAASGTPTWVIKRHTRHATYSAVDRYVRPGEHVCASA